MNKKAMSNTCTLAHFRVLIIVGAVGLLFLLLHAAHGEVTTNSTETSLLLTPSSSAAGPIIFDIISTPAPIILDTASDLASPISNADDSINRVGIIPPITSTIDLLPATLPAYANVGNDGIAGFFTTGDGTSLTLPSSIENTTPIYGSKVLELKDSDAAALNLSLPWAEVRLGWGDSLVQFFAPCSYPSPPSGPQQSDWDESDRPWPVIAGGAASGNSWNEPGLYRAQGFLSICR